MTDRGYGRDHYNFKGNHFELINDKYIGTDFRGEKFIIDQEDYEVVSQYTWTSAKGRDAKEGNYFCTRKSRRDGHQMMMLHNFIWTLHNGEIPNEKRVDHIDQCPWNCSLSNLRLASKAENSINTSLRANNRSGVTGVSWEQRKLGWRAYGNVDGKRIELGVYKDLHKAIFVRLKFEQEHYKEFAPQRHLFKEYGIEE